MLALQRRLQVPVLPQPVGLRREIAVHDIAFFILERPWGDDQDVTFTDPDPFFDLSLDPAHAGDSVIAFDPDMVCTLHQLGKRELFVCPFFWEAHTDRRRSILVHRIEINFVVFLGIVTNRKTTPLYIK